MEDISIYDNIIESAGIDTNIHIIEKYCDIITKIQLSENIDPDNDNDKDDTLTWDLQLLSKLNLQEGCLEITNIDKFKQFVIKIQNIDYRDVLSVDVDDLVRSIFITKLLIEIKNEMKLGSVLYIKRIVMDIPVIEQNIFSKNGTEYINVICTSNYHIKTKN